MQLRSLLVVVLVVFACGRAKDNDAVVIDTSLCELASHPRKYHNVVVRVRAEVRSDGLEHTVLSDDTCGTTLTIVAESHERSDLRELDAAILKSPRGTVLKRISGTFVGRFKERTRGRANAIDLLQASHVEVKPLLSPRVN